MIESQITKFCIIGFLVAASLCSFLVSLDRYPAYYIDEPFFNYPAVRYLNGQGLTYELSPQAPHSDAVFAAHAPIYPWLQVLNFRLFGISQFTCRLPDYLAAHLAILTLAIFLVRQNLYTSAVILCVAWIGDRSAQEVLLGRPDGVALFFLALAFVALVKIMTRSEMRWSILCGFALATAVGIHPMCILFAAVAWVLAVWSVSAGRRVKTTLGFALGAIIPTMFVIWAWSPSLGWAVEQFRWAAQFQVNAHRSDDTVRLLEVLRLSKYWYCGLIAVVIIWLIPLAVYSVAMKKSIVRSKASEPIWLASVGFSLAGLLCLILSKKFPYYLVYFSIWPVISLSILRLSLEAGRPRIRQGATAMAILLTTCWLPSLAWNALRFREMILNRNQLDQTTFASQLASQIPANVQVEGSPELFLIARRAGLNFRPFDWFPAPVDVSPNTWILLSDGNPVEMNRVTQSSLLRRPIIFRGKAFPNAKYLEYPITIYGAQVPDLAPTSAVH